MGNKNDLTKIGDVYGRMLNNIKHNLIAEGKIGPTVKAGKIGQAILKESSHPQVIDTDEDGLQGFFIGEVNGTPIYSVEDSSIRDTMVFVVGQQTVAIDVDGEVVPGVIIHTKYNLPKDVSDFIGRHIADELGETYSYTLKENKLTKLRPTVKAGEIGQAPLIKGGPQETAGYVPAKIDRNKMSKKELKDNLYNIKTLSQPENLEKEEEGKKAPKKAPKKSGKIVKESINNFMRNKSIFDKLYENVMGNEEMEETDELDALGIDTEEDSAEDDVTFTLDRETAQKLHDVLMAQLGDSEVEDAGDDFGGEDYETMEQDEQGFYDEDEEDLGHAGVNAKEPNMGKNNRVGNLKPQSGGATSAYTNKVGNDGDHGHALVNAKQPNMGTNNKVGKLKTGKSMFEQ